MGFYAKQCRFDYCDVENSTLELVFLNENVKDYLWDFTLKERKRLFQRTVENETKVKNKRFEFSVVAGLVLWVP